MLLLITASKPFSRTMEPPVIIYLSIYGSTALWTLADFSVS
jgi:hypothetical protein